MQTFVTRVEAQLRRLQQGLTQGNQGIIRTQQQLTQSFGQLTSTAQTLSAAYRQLIVVWSTLQLGRLLRETTDLATRNRALEIGFRTILGSSQSATRELQFFRQAADRLGLVFLDTAESARGLLAATRGTQLEGQAARDIFLGIAEASRVMGASQEAIGRSFLATQQIIARGNVDLENLRQLSEASLPQALQVFARALNTDTKHLLAMSQAGQLGLDQFLKFARQLRVEVAPGVEAAAKQFDSNFNRMKTGVQELLIEIGNLIINSEIVNNSLKAVGASAKQTAKDMQAAPTGWEKLSVLLNRINQTLAQMIPFGDIIAPGPSGDTTEEIERLHQQLQQLAEERAAQVSLVASQEEAESRLATLRAQFALKASEQAAQILNSLEKEAVARRKAFELEKTHAEQSIALMRDRVAAQEAVTEASLDEQQRIADAFRAIGQRTSEAVTRSEDDYTRAVIEGIKSRSAEREKEQADTMEAFQRIRNRAFAEQERDLQRQEDAYQRSLDRLKDDFADTFRSLPSLVHDPLDAVLKLVQDFAAQALGTMLGDFVDPFYRRLQGVPDAAPGAQGQGVQSPAIQRAIATAGSPGVGQGTAEQVGSTIAFETSGGGTAVGIAPAGSRPQVTTTTGVNQAGQYVAAAVAGAGLAYTSYTLFRNAGLSSEGSGATAGLIGGATVGGQVGGVYGAIIGAIVGAMTGFIVAASTAARRKSLIPRTLATTEDVFPGETVVQSPFGFVGPLQGGTRLRGESEAKFARLIASIDVQIAAVLDSKQEALVREALIAQRTGPEISFREFDGEINELLADRFSTVLQALGASTKTTTLAFQEFRNTDPNAAGVTARFEELLAIFKSIEEFKRPASELSAGAQALRDLNNQFDNLAESASRFNIDLTEIEAARQQRTLEITQGFNQSINDQIRAFTDPQGLALDQLQRQHDQQVTEAESIGGDLVAIEQLYGLKREEILQASVDNQIRTQLLATQAFNSTVQQQILALTDPNAAAEAQLAQNHRAQVEEARRLGGDLVAVERLYGLQRQQVVEQQLAAINAFNVQVGLERTQLANPEQAPYVALDIERVQRIQQAQAIGADVAAVEALYSARRLQIAKDAAAQRAQIAQQEADQRLQEQIAEREQQQQRRQQRVQINADVQQQLLSISNPVAAQRAQLLRQRNELMNSAMEVGANVGDIQRLYLAQIAQVNAEVRQQIAQFNADIQQQILSLSDPQAAQFAQLTIERDQRLAQAKEIGASILGIEELYGLQRAALAKQFAARTVDFNAEIQQQILQLTDPLAAQFAQLDRQRDQQIAQAKEVGGDINAIERLYALQREHIVQESAERQLTTLRNYLQSITSGPQSALPTRQRLRLAQDEFDRQRAAALGGRLDEQALVTAASNLRDVAQTAYASGPQRQAIEALIRSTITAVIRTTDEATQGQTLSLIEKSSTNTATNTYQLVLEVRSLRDEVTALRGELLRLQTRQIAGAA